MILVGVHLKCVNHAISLAPLKGQPFPPELHSSARELNETLVHRRTQLDDSQSCFHCPNVTQGSGEVCGGLGTSMKQQLPGLELHSPPTCPLPPKCLVSILKKI